MISTGMYGIDDMLGGGIPKGSRVITASTRESTASFS